MLRTVRVFGDPYCKPQGGAICFAQQLSRALVMSILALGMCFIRVTSMRKQWLRFSRARDSRSCFHCTQQHVGGRIESSWSLRLFFLVCISKRWPERRLDVMTTPGVHTLVSIAANRPLFQLTRSRPFDGLRKRRPRRAASLLNVGDRMRVKCGPLVGIEGSWSERRIFIG